MAKQTYSASAPYSRYQFIITGVGKVSIIAQTELEAHRKLHETYGDIQNSCSEYKPQPNPLSILGPVEVGESIPYQPNKMRKLASQQFTAGLETQCSMCGRTFDMCGCDITID